MQKVMTLHTEEDNMRSSADGWDFEDGRQALKAFIRPEGYEVEVGKIGGCGSCGDCPKTPLHALGMGWHLLSPPVFIKDAEHKELQWKWWFTCNS